uniref:Extended FMRFamide-2 n=1 Tax=Pachyphasma brandbergense TaxID=1041430 RepID=FAR2_PACBA|nr:RecName: Full=Extended FMRFamide-2; Short=FMRFa-2 [Pachyphasma brandbergense]
SDYLQLART